VKGISYTENSGVKSYLLTSSGQSLWGEEVWEGPGDRVWPGRFYCGL
jgi:hypothetical protein